MRKLEIIRPDASFAKDQREQLLKFLCDHWERVQASRSDQLQRYSIWEKNYRAIPAEEVRNVPWYKASNFVVPLIRIFLDTFVARTLNIIFATRPLFDISGFPREDAESLAYYVNQKALSEWEMYLLTRDLLQRGNKNGTAIVKSVHSLEKSIYVSGSQDAPTFEEIVNYAGPRSSIVSFEDFAVYPVTANYLRDVKIKFHQVRIIEESAKRFAREANWGATDEEIEKMLVMPADIEDQKRTEQDVDAGVVDPYLKELHAVECHLQWELGGKYYNIVALIEPKTPKLLDVYFNPYPNNWEIFQDYRPFPREDHFYGESLATILQQAQEETSQIHNDRRNNSYLANAPVFKRRNGSLVPNPSTNWYPGKVFDLESLDDLDVISVGRNFSDTMGEENWDLQLAERLSGIGAQMQGYAGGMMGKRGIYNAAGTLALMSESNQRQDTNIRDAREVISAVGRSNLMIQAYYSADDPIINTFPPEMQEQIRRALVSVTPNKLRYAQLKVHASDAGANKEVTRQNLLQLTGVLNNYAGAAQQMAMQLVNPNLNPGLRAMMNDTLTMLKWIATRVLRAFDEYDAEGVLPNVAAAIEKALPGGSAGTKGPSTEAGVSGTIAGGDGSPVPALSREGLESLLSIPQPVPGGTPGPGMGAA